MQTFQSSYRLLGLVLGVTAKCKVYLLWDCHMSAQTSFTLPALGGGKPVYADIRTTLYWVIMIQEK